MTWSPIPWLGLTVPGTRTRLRAGQWRTRRRLRDRHGQHPGLRRRVSATLAAAAAGPVPAAVGPAGDRGGAPPRRDVPPGALAAARAGAAPGAPAHQPARRLPGGRSRAGADPHVPGLGGGRWGGVMLPRRPPGERQGQAFLREAWLAPGRRPRRGARYLPCPPDRLARASPG